VTFPEGAISDAAAQAYESWAPPARSVDVVVEHDGYRLEASLPENRYRLIDLRSGEQVLDGDTNFLMTDRPPVFADPTTEEILVALTWEEWSEARNRAIEAVAETPRLLRSIDGGRTWTVDELPFMGRNGSAGPAGMLMIGGTECSFGVCSYDVWRSPDAASWQRAGTISGRFRWGGPVVGTEDGYLFCGGDEVWFSLDGVHWAVEITREDLGLPIAETGFALAQGPAGTAGLVTQWGFETEGEAIAINRNGRTLELRRKAGDVAHYRLIDASTREEVLNEAIGIEDGWPTSMSWQLNGGLFFDTEGTILFAASGPELSQVWDLPSPVEQDHLYAFVFRDSAGGWQTEPLDRHGAQLWYVVVGRDSVLLPGYRDDGPGGLVGRLDR
jgi:hypothetical protein